MTKTSLNDILRHCVAPLAETAFLPTADSSRPIPMELNYVYKMLIISMAMAAIAGCQPTGSPPIADQEDNLAATSNEPPQTGQIMARVNGRAITNQQLYNMLLDRSGYRLSRQIICNELVKQMAAEKKVTITDADIAAEHNRTIEQMAPGVKTANEKEQLLIQLMQSRSITRRTWNMIMWRNAVLRKLVSHDINIPADTIQKQFDREHGRRVVVREVAAKSIEIARLVKDLAENKADFIELTDKYSLSLSAQNGGLLPPIGRDTIEASPAIRQVAMTMQTIGEISDPVQVGKRFHILKLEKVLAPDKVKLEDVRPQIVAKLKERVIRAEGHKLLLHLTKTADIEYVDPILKSKDEQNRLARKGNTP